MLIIFIYYYSLPTLPYCPHSKTLPNLHPFLFPFLVINISTQVQLILSMCTWMYSHLLGHKQSTKGHIFEGEWLLRLNSHQPLRAPSGGMPGSPSPIHAASLTALILCKSCASNHSSWELVCAAVVLCAESWVFNSSAISRSQHFTALFAFHPFVYCFSPAP